MRAGSAGLVLPEIPGESPSSGVDELLTYISPSFSQSLSPISKYLSGLHWISLELSIELGSSVSVADGGKAQLSSANLMTSVYDTPWFLHSSISDMTYI